MILLNPGPVNVSERVRQALMRPDICHRESEFAELLHRIQGKLLNAFVPGAEAEYAAVLLTGSGTAAVESRMGTYLRQIGGPALGIWQVEPATHLDCWDNWLDYRPVKQLARQELGRRGLEL